MKKIIFGLIATVCFTLNTNAQRPIKSLVDSYPCPVGTHPVLSFEFNTLRFHRASTGCERRFSICSDGEWVIDCVNNTNRLSNYNSKDNLAKIVGEFTDDYNYITLHFPIEIMKLKEYLDEDFNDFGFDTDYHLTKDIIIEKGEYKTVITNNEIVVKVKLK